MDNNATYNIDDLLVKYLLEEATAGEKEKVQHWLQESDENRSYFNHFSLIWEESRKLASTSTVDENKAWQHFKQRVEKTESAKIVSVPKSSPWPARIAAIFIGLMVMSAVYWFVNKNTEASIDIVKSGSTVLTDSLADGSVVTLNKNSSIAYNKKLKGNTRSVQLTGEAFFEVAPDKSKPFVITVNDVTIKVVGTSFNVKTVNGNTEVNVETGIVEVMHHEKTISLKAKEKIIVGTDKTEMQKDSSHGKLYNYYRTKTFVCDNTPLWQLVAALNEAYGENVVIENKSIRSLPLTVTFDEEPIDNILLIVAETLNIKAEKKDNQIVLR